MNEIPDPLTPNDCDLRGMEWMPMFGHRLYSSNFDSLATDAEFRAANRLWWMAWQQVPAASLPADDAVLASLAGYRTDPRGWKKLRREVVLHGFMKCSDGRLYHALLAEEAIKSFDLRLAKERGREADRERLRRWRAAQKSTRGSPPRNGHGNAGETRFTTNQEGADETVGETRSETTLPPTPPFPGQDKTGQDSAPPIVPPRGDSVLFDAWWDRYPRKVGKGAARKAFEVAVRRKGVTPSDLLAAVERQRWPQDIRYIPHPAVWLSQERWLDDPGAAAPPPVVAESRGERLRRELDEQLGLSRAPEAEPRISYEGLLRQ